MPSKPHLKIRAEADTLAVELANGRGVDAASLSSIMPLAAHDMVEQWMSKGIFPPQAAYSGRWRLRLEWEPLA
jgi:hypothetical protein